MTRPRTKAEILTHLAHPLLPFRDFSLAPHSSMLSFCLKQVSPSANTNEDGKQTPFWWGPSDSSDISSQMPAGDINTPADLSRSNPNDWNTPIHFDFTVQWRGIVIDTLTFFFRIVKSHHQKLARVHEAEWTVKATVGFIIHTWWG